MGIGGLLHLRVESPSPLLPAIIGITSLWMYSYPPVRLSYSSGEEFLQMIGVDIILPLIGYSAFVKNLVVFPWELLILILPTQLAYAIGTAVPDEHFDAEDLKRTISYW